MCYETITNLSRRMEKTKKERQMKKAIPIVVIGFVVLIALGGFNWYINVRNGLVRLEENVKEKWSQVEIQYQRRADLIPNLVEVVKGYAAHEKETLTKVIEARAKATQIKISAEDLKDPEKLAKFQAAQGELSMALGKLMMLKEQYPELKADKMFLALQSQIEGTENRIAVERRRYNQAAKEFNTTIRLFPQSMVASSMGLKPYAYFKAETGSEKAPKVKF